MADTFDKYASGLDSPAELHTLIVPSDAVEIAKRPRALYVNTTGVLIMIDEGGTTLTYNVTAGAILPFRPLFIKVGTTAEIIAWV